jgi:hypothetical protein
MFEDIVKKKEKILCGECEKNGKHYAKKLEKGKLYRCEVCGRTFGKP